MNISRTNEAKRTQSAEYTRHKNLILKRSGNMSRVLVEEYENRSGGLGTSVEDLLL